MEALGREREVNRKQLNINCAMHHSARLKGIRVAPKCMALNLTEEAIAPEGIPTKAKVGTIFEGSAYRVESYLLAKGKTAQEIVDFEAEELGNVDIKEQAESLGIDLSAIPENRVVWVTKTKKDAESYGKPEKYELPKGSRIIATDGEGGYLVVKPAKTPPRDVNGAMHRSARL